MRFAPPGTALALTVASNDGNRDKGKLVMIDDPRTTEQLLSSLEAAIPSNPVLVRSWLPY
jgi:hypothetical protein